MLASFASHGERKGLTSQGGRRGRKCGRKGQETRTSSFPLRTNMCLQRARLGTLLQRYPKARQGSSREPVWPWKPRGCCTQNSTGLEDEEEWGREKAMDISTPTPLSTMSLAGTGVHSKRLSGI